MDVSDKIRAIREEKRIKQIEIANALELDPSYYAKLEKRGNKMTLEQLEKIAQALGVTAIELISDSTATTGLNTSQLIQDNESFKKRIGELEKWLQDKEARNAANEREIRTFKDKINSILITIIHEYAQDNLLTTDMFDVIVKRPDGKIGKYWVTEAELNAGSKQDGSKRGTFNGMKVIEIIMGYTFDENVNYDAIRDFIQKFELHPFDLILFDIMFEYCDDEHLNEILKPFKEARRMQINYWKNWPLSESRADNTAQGETNPGT